MLAHKDWAGPAAFDAHFPALHSPLRREAGAPAAPPSRRSRMPYRILFLTLALLAVSALAGAATLPASPAPAAPAVTPPAPATALPWLQPAANSTPEKPGLVKPGKAPLGALFKSGCGWDCFEAESACFNGCGGDHDCNVNCSNDYYCCLQSCDPSGPQCN